MINLGSLDVRKLLIEEIESEENKNRKRKSYIEYEIYRDNQHPYVYDYLQGQFSEKTVKEMPIISSINLSQRIVNQEASLYKNAPKREFSDVNDVQKEQLTEIYDAGSFNSKLLKSNRMLKLQGQSLLYVIPYNGMLTLKVLLPHMYDVIPNEINPEVADGYIINAFDRSLLNAPTSVPMQSSPTGNTEGYYSAKQYSDGLNQKIADPDDYKMKARYVVWTKELNFIMDGYGNVLSQDPMNPIQILPFVDIFHDKDMEYFVRQGQAVTDFSVQFNGTLSDLASIIKMQGWAQAYLKGPADLIPENIQVGPNSIIKLPINPNNPVDTEFGFVSPNPDLQGSIAFVETLLAMFMSSRGVDPKTVSGKQDSQKFTSGIERLLAMVEKFEASKEDYSLYRMVESKFYEIIKTYINVYGGTDVLPNWTYGTISEKSKVDVQYMKPEIVQTEEEKLNTIQSRMELGLITKSEAIAIDREITVEAAEEIKEKIESENKMMLQSQMMEAEEEDSQEDGEEEEDSESVES